LVVSWGREHGDASKPIIPKNVLYIKYGKSASRGSCRKKKSSYSETAVKSTAFKGANSRIQRLCIQKVDELNI